MQLSVPELSEANEGSFPLLPEKVAAWLAELDTLNNDADARELLRGLTHSNRLANDPDQRRAVIALFVPSLRALHERLMISASAQPMPLIPDFARDAELADALLREESVAFRLLLASSEVPREVDARRAMRALLRRAELAVHNYRKIPDEVWRDAHTLYRFAQANDLAHELKHEDAADQADHIAQPDLDKHYRLLLLLAIVDPSQLRARQLPLLIEWLRDRASLVTVTAATPESMALAPRAGVWWVNFDRGTAPSPAGSLLVTQIEQIGTIELRALQLETESRIRQMRMTRSSLLGADVLERQTLARLALRLGSGRVNQRRHARRRSARRVDCVFSHKYITSRLLHEQTAEQESPGAHADTFPTVDQALPLGMVGGSPSPTIGWTVVDESPGGYRIENPSAAPGSVQVGELVSINNYTQSKSVGGNSGKGTTRKDVLLGVIRHVHSGANGFMSVGIGVLAHAVIPVVVSRLDESSSAPENGLIIAARAGEVTLRTILVPPFLYQSGEQLSVAQGERSSQVELSRCLQLNGLFSQYELKTIASQAA